MHDGPGPNGGQHELERQLAQGWPPERWAGMRVLVAVSGGADSMALLRGMAQLATGNGARLAVGHLNHGLRGSASDADERLVRDLAAELGLECHVGRIESGAVQSAGDGIEAAARAVRYEFLTGTAEQIGARYVVTAHTADDQVETILHHVLRGTGLAGLGGMPRVRALSPAVTLVRPLLAVRRAAVVEYLAELGQTFREDATNADVSLTRNRIRHELLPLLAREYSPNVHETLLRLAAVAREAHEVIERQAEQLLERAITEGNAGRLVIDCRLLNTTEPHVLREMFVVAWRRQAWPRQAMGWEEWNLLAELAGGGAVLGRSQGELGAEEALLGKPAVAHDDAAKRGEARVVMLPGGVRAEKTGEQLVLARS